MRMNTQEYWENRFSTSDWAKRGGNTQSVRHAQRYIGLLDISEDFQGTICDFGCAEGDAIPVYAARFPRAKLIGIDFSTTAIKKARKRFGDCAEFIIGGLKSIPECDVIICSHTLEHIEDDIGAVRHLRACAKSLYIIVPYKECPLSREHLRVYDEASFEQFLPLSTKVQPAGWAFVGLPWIYHVAMKNLVRPLFGIDRLSEPKQIIFHIGKS